MIQKLPDQLQWKMYRVKQHLMELQQELRNYYASEPGELVPHGDSSPENRLYKFVSKKPVPARFGLIAGDFLQNLRSALDYLVWQLVIANGNEPRRSNSFPICMTEAGYRNCLKNNYLKGAAPDAQRIINLLQPYHRPKNSTPSELQVLDELTNINKHRRLLVTDLGSVHKRDEPFPVPHIELEVFRTSGGTTVPGGRFLSFIRLEDKLVKGLEISSCLEALGNYVLNDVFPKFERFF